MEHPLQQGFIKSKKIPFCAYKIPFCDYKIPFCEYKAIFAFDLVIGMIITISYDKEDKEVKYKGN